MDRKDFYNLIFNDVYRENSKVAIKDNNGSISYEQLQEEINRCANCMKKSGIQKNDKIGLMIKTHRQFITLFLAGILADAAIVPIYTNIGKEKIDRIVEELNINYIISEKQIDGNTSEPFLCMQDELYLTKEISAKRKVDDIDDDIILIMMTSGTTNKAKGVMLSTTNISSNIKSICDYINFRDDDNVLIVKNTNHISTIVGEMLLALYTGVISVYNSNVIGINNLSNIINKNKVTIFFAVPFLLEKLLEQEVQVGQSLRLVNFYGAKMNTKNVQKLIEKYPKVNFIYSYGQTEASPRITYIERDDLMKYIGSSGKAVSGVSIMIQDKEGNVLEQNQTGEIVVSGLNIMRGYYNNPEMTKKVIVDGNLHTGDLGYINEDGYLYVVGRQDNMIIINGKNIHPEEIEMIVAGYEGVVEVLVEEKQYGRTRGLVCYVVKKNDTEIDVKDLLRYVRDRVEDYKIPREVIFVEQLEKTTSGKVKRNRTVER